MTIRALCGTCGNTLEKCQCKDDTPQLSWSELAELTHVSQVEMFGFCTCEDGPKVYDDCTQDGA